MTRKKQVTERKTASVQIGTLTQIDGNRTMRKVFYGTNISGLRIGEVIDDGGLELVTHLDMHRVDVLFRSPESIHEGHYDCAEGGTEIVSHLHIGNKYSAGSNNLTEQRIYQALCQLLNEHGISE